LAIATPYYVEHPILLSSVAAMMLLAGAGRMFAARRILRQSQADAGGARLLHIAMYATALPWGIFCALTLSLYPTQWTAMLVMLSTAALASGLTSSLAPDVTLATRSILLMVTPTIVAALLQADRGHQAFGVATAIYLAFLVVQAREQGRTFWKVSVAAERERLRNSAERRRIEAERATLALAIEQAAEEFLITDAEGNIQYCNPAFERLTGYSRDEVIGSNPSILRSGKQDAEFFRNLWDTIRAGRVWTGRITNRRKDGSLYEAEGTISPIHDAEGRVTGFVSARHDVTERLRLESQLRQSQRMESIGRLAGGIAHDFNNLLTVILGYSRVLLAEHSSPEDPLNGFVKEISAAGERAASLTRQLLSFSRKQILVPRAIALDALVAEMRPMLQRLVGEDIRVEVPPSDGPYMVRADPDQMSQIFMNLAANARDAMSQGGLLFIRVTEATPDQVPSGAPARLAAGPVVRLTVSDSGQGIDEETRLRMFEPFFTTKELGHGTGLGLATVYGIVEQSEGFIEVSSEPGKGAAFHIYLPRVGDVAESVKTPVAVEETKGGSETILVVEDQDDLRRLVVTVLRARGYRVLDASDGHEALRVMAETAEAIDLLLTDVIMPDITGKQVADQARQSRPGIRVLFMSGYPGEVIARRGVLDRGVSYLPKPFSVEALTGKVREVLDTTQR
ncbi:MAG TPA: PAS domain S-box protein, partial [Candidatus Acidoferrum sp.]|nr:PAS domain S-box protein [Candidatus Acidoferrum sp.]